jgi:hypothetical protein
VANEAVEVRACGLGMGVFSRQTIEAGGTVISLAPAFTSTRDRHTVQIGERRHQMYTGDPDDFVNHSCNPNCRLDVESCQFVALVDIAPGQEITFNYLTSEWEMTEPFTCLCDGRSRLIRGYRFLSSEERDEIHSLVPRWMLAAQVALRTS